MNSHNSHSCFSNWEIKQQSQNLFTPHKNSLFIKAQNTMVRVAALHNQSQSFLRIYVRQGSNMLYVESKRV